MTRRKSLKYISKIKQIAFDFFASSSTGKSATSKPTTRTIPEDAKDEIDDIFAYKQGRHKHKRKKHAKRMKLKK